MSRISHLGARPPEQGQNPGNPHGYTLWGGLLLLAIALFTPGCAGPAPVVQEVKIPVYTPCVKVAPARPAFESLLLPGDASNGEKVLALARDTVLHFKYEGQLEAALVGCL